MSEPTKDELMERLAAALREQESVTMALIWLELGELLTGLAATEDQAAAALRDACEALTEPEADLAARDRAIADAEGACVRWSEQLADDNPDRRAEARMHFNEWSAEVDARRAARDEAERGYRELFGEREEARKALRFVQVARQRVMRAQLDPFGDDLATATSAYRTLRMPFLGNVLLLGQRDHREWDQAKAQLRTWCLHAGYRGEDLPAPGAINAEAMTAAMASAAESAADPVPSAAEVKARATAEFENMALQQSAARNVVEDRRPAHRQHVPARPEMQVQTLRDLGVR